MVSNASSDKRQGLIQGSAASISNALRAFGPAVTGAIFSISTIWKFPGLLFWLLTATYAFCLFLQHQLTEKEKHILCHGEDEKNGEEANHNALVSTIIADNKQVNLENENENEEEMQMLTQKSEESNNNDILVVSENGTQHKTNE